ncbi:methyltransferase domain-containing protein [Caulobacter vibrioides]|uniref:class I SAM-dependent methyltransferase n=1 Tax=Caulobacter vibrioides TaxID=155892 RepID=UPI000BB52B10|nr:class I SAM-dependent methyltransferase [Caulobacter vibrioides]ATC26359.1 methyltransferase domain-containing protein [Caulobacter vibrioides]AZH14489.1 methyltransferase domain-containing protein [Caulobacter vibrioides]PLR17221.1 methyltransferase domain-containing protein [Caulobacter vibrioides]
MSGVATDMSAYWDRAGRVWVEQQALLDRLFQPIAQAVVDRADLRAGEAVLDVGCGSGATTFEAAWRVGPQGRAVGADISGALLELARRRAGEQGLEGVDFVQADAQTHDFDAGFDAIVSRFGVMFFPDPVAAFANLRRALKPDGRLAFACWRGPEDNPMAQVPLDAAAPFLPETPRFERNAPGRFGFADPERVRSILAEAGWRDIAIAPLDDPTPVSFDELMTMSLRVGPLNPILSNAEDALRTQVRDAVAAALAPHVQDGMATMNSACWLVTARG